MVLLKELFDDAMKKYNLKGRPPRKHSDYKKGATGFAHVTIIPCDRCRQGFYYQYYWLDMYNNRRKISSVDINKLRTRVKEKGWDWFIDNKPLAQQTLKRGQVPYTLNDLK